MISYKPLWVTLAQRDLKRTNLMEMANISSATIAKMGKNGNVALDIIDKICAALNCGVSDVIEYVRTDD